MELWNAGFSHEHVYLARYYFAFLCYFSPDGEVSTSEKCEDGACWDRRVDAAHGSLSEELVEEGPLEARTVVCGTDSLLSGPLQCVPPVLGGRRLWVWSSACAGAAVHLSAARDQVHFRGMSHWITPLLRPFTHCLSRGEGWVCADVSMPKSS